MLEELWTATMTVIRSNEEAAAGLAFAVSMGESIPVLSFVAPSTVLLGAKSVLIGAGQLPFLPIFLAAWAGAIVGDLVAYAIGARLGPRLATAWPLSRNPAILERGEAFFRRWGFWSLFACRFIGPLRWVMPTMAGTCAMPLPVYLTASVLSALLWAAVVLVPGSFGIAWAMAAL